ncbi:MAG: hypothetical protein AAFV88_15910 [Planctomycetota bacterium]
MKTNDGPNAITEGNAVKVLIPAVLAFGLLACETASAQTVVQLPSFRSFSYSGSVLVPDRGATYLGGVRRSASSQTRRNGFGRGFGFGQSAGGATAHVTIIDNKAIDAHIRGLSSLGVSPSSRIMPKVDPDAEGKALVRFARKQYQLGRNASSQEAYRLAIQTLSPHLSELAKREYQRVFPVKRR